MADLPPGFRFYPTEEELVSFYLRMKLQGRRLPDLGRVIPDVDIYELEPWHLPKHAGEVCKADTEQWFFFTPRQEREARGGRPSRTTGSGYWKATGSPTYVYSSDNRVIGVKKTMVFYNGKAPAGRKTKWKMHEYRAIEVEATNLNSTTAVPKLRHEFSLSRVYVVSGSFRAFDRRPLGTAAREDTGQQVRQHTHSAADAAAAAQIREKTSSSPESLCSGGGEDHLDFEASPAPPGDFLWDWEQLDWVESRGGKQELVDNM